MAASPGTLTAQITPADRQRLSHITRSEFIKLTSLRSTIGLLAGGAAFVVLSGASAAVTTVMQKRSEGSPPAGFDAVATSATGVSTMAFLVGIIGVLQVTSELSTGLGRSTFAATPRRGLVVLGKAAALTLVIAPAAALISAVTHAVTQLILATEGLEAPLLSVDSLQLVAGAGGCTVALGLFGQLFAWLVRSTIGAAFALLGVVAILGSLIRLVLPPAIANDIVPFLPAEAASALMGTDPSGASLPIVAALPVTAAWYALALVLGAWLLKRRDA